MELSNGPAALQRLLRPQAAEQFGFLLGLGAGGDASRGGGLAEKINGEGSLAQALATARTLASHMLAHPGSILGVEGTKQVQLIQLF